MLLTQFELLAPLLGYFSKGGFVMMPLLATCLLMWYGLSYRYLILRRAQPLPRKGAKTLATNKLPNSLTYSCPVSNDSWCQGIIGEAYATCLNLSRTYRGQRLRDLISQELYGYQDQLDAFSTLVRSAIVIAPLLGLLGTVSGMIETFDSLGDMQLYSQSGGIAAGVSTALFTTQFGLVIAVPGLLLARILDRRQQVILTELTCIKDHLLNQE